jgi:hypothetical protein
VKAVSSDIWFEIDHQFRREGIAVAAAQKDFRVILQDEQLSRLIAAVDQEAPFCPSEAGLSGGR